MRLCRADRLIMPLRDAAVIGRTAAVEHGFSEKIFAPCRRHYIGMMTFQSNTFLEHWLLVAGSRRFGDGVHLFPSKRPMRMTTTSVAVFTLMYPCRH